MTSLSKSSNPCVSQVTQKPFSLTSIEIEKWLRQSTLFTGLTCESSRLSLDPKTWHGSHFYLEILVCKFWQDLKMDHLPMLMRDHFNVKMFLSKFFPLGRSFITMPNDSWLTKKSWAEGDQLHGGLAKYVRVDTRFHFTT